MSICILYNNLGPYHLARLQALRRVVSGLMVIELASQSSIYKWRANKTTYNWQQVTLFPGKTTGDLSASEIKKNLFPVFDRISPRVIITAGYTDPLAQLACKWGRQNGAKNILMIDSWKGDKNRFWLKERVKSVFVQHNFDAAFVGGGRHVSYARSLGFSEQQIWRGVDVVDNQHFTIGATYARLHDKKLCADLELPNRYFLCVARYSPEKNLMRLLQSFKAYREQGGRWHLLLLGDGTQRQLLNAEIQQLNLKTAKLVGWVQYNELPIYYGLASALILPSISEPWGLVVNEAMASGLPVLVSRKAGCQPELCWRGVNGFDFVPFNIEQMTQTMMKISSLPTERLKQMGEASSRIIGNFTPETWTNALVDCIDTTRNTR